jgi:hypothetical protein
MHPAFANRRVRVSPTPIALWESVKRRLCLLRILKLRGSCPPEAMTGAVMAPATQSLHEYSQSTPRIRLADALSARKTAEHAAADRQSVGQGSFVYIPVRSSTLSWRKERVEVSVVSFSQPATNASKSVFSIRLSLLRALT